MKHRAKGRYCPKAPKSFFRNEDQDQYISMLRNLLQAQSPGVEAGKRTLALASLKLLLFISVLSFCLSKIVLLNLDSAIYEAKGEFVAWYCSVALFSLGMILDASYVLGKKIQSAAADKRRGIAGIFLQLLVLIVSPLRLLGLVTIIAAAGMMGSVISLLAVIF
jgi:hypothetical protein